MSPIATDKVADVAQTQGKTTKAVFKDPLTFLTENISPSELAEQDATYEFDDLKPSFPERSWPETPLYEVSDKALLADPNNGYANLLRDATNIHHLSPKIGTVIEGVSLADLDDTQRNELALLIARRVAVFFRAQHDLTIEKQLDLGRYYGPLQKHPVSGIPKATNNESLDEVHVVWSDETQKRPVKNPSAYYWHSDVTYERQPPSYTSLKILSGPEIGGDTLWTSGYALYDALSPSLQKYLEGLKAVHSAVSQADDARSKGKPVRRAPIVTEHPIVRTHPVTGYKSLYISPGFTKHIAGIPTGESNAILAYIHQIIATGQEATARFKWAPGDVAFWDNRVSVHTASFGFFPQRRHGVRVTPHGEVPYFDPNGKSQQAEIDANIAKAKESKKADV